MAARAAVPLTVAPFGVPLRSSVALPGVRCANADGDMALELQVVRPAAVARAFSGPSATPAVGHRTVDGAAWRVERGRAGDLLLSWGTAGAFHIDAGAQALLAAGDVADPAWQRVLLDSVLVTVALARGAEALHAAVVADGDCAVALLGARGTGKTSLALALLREGAVLVSDDIAVLASDAAVVHPGPPVMSCPHGSQVGGELLHRFATEDWILAECAAAEPVALRAVVLLDRSAPAGTPPVLTPVPHPGPVLLAHALDSGPGRRLRRFGRVADLAAEVPVKRLYAPSSATPGMLARALTA